MLKSGYAYLYAFPDIEIN